ncbi:GNAT family N-acetyltransferase [Vogesella sp. LIG4]|uniref:GNAT family N-acetyltransferase n=1 Tax=Vogesella sp. LIG4 TaxID=1192162 RepID=UPI00082015A7|nr:GNAT family N-acetyltransferase [Vogesella sp. LIG4]SCK21463.1 Acetyltransferases [Vogesella sp. LIG4]
MSAPILSVALPEDAALLADLHLRSWRVAYRGVLPDSYLDGPCEQEMRDKWQQRMAAPAGEYLACIVRIGGEAAGFVCLQPDFAPGQGIYLDNLHVLPAWQGSGLGKLLLAWAAAQVQQRWPGQALLLHVLDGNLPARRVYRRLGGIETKLPDERMADGALLKVSQVTWQDVPALLLRLQS